MGEECKQRITVKGLTQEHCQWAKENGAKPNLEKQQTDNEAGLAPVSSETCGGKEGAELWKETPL